MRWRIVGAVLVMLGLGLLLALRGRLDDPKTPPMSDADARAPTPTTRPLDRATPIASASTVAVAKPAPRRTRLMPAAADRVPTASPSATHAPRLKIADLGGKLVDRRDDPGADAPSELELIHAGLDTIHEDIEDCLAEWQGTDARADGEVMIAFQLDESGLTDSWVVRDAELPFGIRTCFANAVHGVDWSHIVRQPAEITERFQLEREDAGP